MGMSASHGQDFKSKRTEIDDRGKVSSEWLFGVARPGLEPGTN